MSLDLEMDFYEAWWFLVEHPEFKIDDYEGNFEDCLCIEVQKVNPATETIDDNEKLNTKVEIWLECGGYIFDDHLGRVIPCHDTRLDCGGDTFEEAIINLAKKVKQFY